MRLRSIPIRLSLCLALAVLGLAVVLPALAGTRLDSVKVKLNIDSDFVNDLDPIDAHFLANFAFADTLSDGNAVDKAEVVYLKNDSVTASGTDSWDLSTTGANLTDAFGNTITCTKLKGVVVWNKSSTAGDILNVVRPATDGAAFLGADGDLVPVGPNGVFFWYNPSLAGVAVADGDTDNIDIVETGTANTVSYQIMFICTDS